jgi:hypothetical protein
MLNYRQPMKLLGYASVFCRSIIDVQSAQCLVQSSLLYKGYPDR